MKRAFLFLALVASTSFGQLLPLSNVFLRATGIRLGTATNQEEGSLRYVTNQLQLFRNGVWGNIQGTNDVYWSTVSNEMLSIIASISNTAVTASNQANTVAQGLVSVGAVATNAQVTASNAMPKAGGTFTGTVSFLTTNGISPIGYINFTTNNPTPVATGRLNWDSTNSTLQLGINDINLKIGEQLMLYARNVDTNGINRGDVVVVVGATGDRPSIKRASNLSEELSARTIGIAAEDIAKNDVGFVVTRGTVYKVNTAAFTEGSPLYLSSNGTLQTNLPAAPLNGTFIGIVERSNANNGQIYVAVQNYQELTELSDVHISNPSNEQVLVYVAVSNRWENRTVPAALVAGVTATTAYRGDWGAYVSNRADSAFSLAVDTSNKIVSISNTFTTIGVSITNAQVTSSNALRRSGDTYAGSFNAAGYSLTNLSLLSTSNLIVTQTQTIYSTKTIISNTVIVGTQYIDAIYSTNYSYNIVGTNYYTTNYITTIVNVDGSIDYSQAAWVKLPHLIDTRTNGPVPNSAVATGLWDFTYATVTGLALGGGTITNATGSGLLYLGVNGASITGGLSTAVATNGQWMADVLQYGGSTSRFNFVSTTTNFSGKYWDFIFADTTAASVTVTLPKASANTNAPLVTKKVAVGNLLLIGAQSGDTVEGTNEIGLSVSGNLIELISDGGTNWWVR